jgi:uncharacterized protein (DUF433 family)
MTKIEIIENEERQNLIEQAAANYPKLDMWMIEAAVDLYLKGELDEPKRGLASQVDNEPNAEKNEAKE